MHVLLVRVRPRDARNPPRAYDVRVLSENEILVNLATIVVFGIGAQWIGRRLGFPSLLLLLPAGLLAGDVLGLVEPERLLGDLLFPLVTPLVALLLFQSGLQLRFADLPEAARVPVLRLITVGLAITFLGASRVRSLRERRGAVRLCICAVVPGIRPCVRHHARNRLGRSRRPDS